MIDRQGRRMFVSVLAMGALLTVVLALFLWPGQAAQTWAANDVSWQLASTGLPDVGQASAVAFGDYDGDGRLELFASMADGGIQLWTYDGDLTWSEADAAGLPITGTYSGLALADLDHDGRLEMAASGSLGLRVYTRGPVAWSEHSLSTEALYELAVSDVNLDGHPDILATNPGATGNGIKVWLGDGSGSDWLASSLLNASGPLRGIALADFDHNGYPDVAAGRDTSDGGVYAWYFCEGEWGEASLGLPDGSGAWRDVALADFDNDGKLDLAASGDQGLRVWTGDGKRKWTEAATGLPTTGSYAGLSVGDLDNDGWTDMVAVRTDGQGIETWQNHSGHSWGLLARPAEADSWANVALADVDSDGILDLAASGQGNQGLRVWVDGGTDEHTGQWVEIASPLDSSSPRALSLADLDWDGKLDIAAAMGANAGLQAWVGDGGHTWSECSTGLPLSGTYYALALGPLKDESCSPGSAAPELIVAGEDGIQAYERSGCQWSLHGTGLPVSGSYRALAMDDIDHDGRPEVVGALWGTGALSMTWQIETVDSGGPLSFEPVGLGSSLALDQAGWPHISYYDGANEQLKYATYDGSAWVSETLDVLSELSIFTSLALDTADLPHLAYCGERLGYARQLTTTWQLAVLDENARANHISLALDASQRPRISYYDSTNRDLKYTSYFCLMGNCYWYAITVDPGEPAGTGDVGQYSSLALNAGGYPRISYYDATGHDLKYAYLDGSTWISQVVDAAGDVGRYSSLALDASGAPHIAYYDATNGDLKYAHLDGSTWASQVVDAAGDVGQHASLALDASDVPHIAYYDATHADLKYARHDGSAWVSGTVDAAGDVGQHASLALDASAYPHISYYDADNGDLKYAAARGGSLDIWEYRYWGNWLPSPSPFVSSTYADLALGDLNADGELDLVAANSAGLGVQAWLYDELAPGTAWSTAYAITSSGEYRAVALGELNGDGYLDVAAAGAAGIGLWLGDGTAGQWTSLASPLVTGQYLDVDLADFNHDGFLDILAAGDGEGVSVWAGDGAGNWTESSTNLPASGSFSASRFGHVDHDGFPDLVTAQAGGGLRLWTAVAPAPSWAGFCPSTWVSHTQTVSASVQVVDSGSGLDVSTAQYAYSTDGGVAWSPWLSATLPAFDGVRTAQTMTTSAIAFGQDSLTSHLNRVKFRITNMAGTAGESPVYNVDIDTFLPTNPSSLSGDRNTAEWSNHFYASMSWSGAQDASSGIDGYSYEWSSSPGIVPDEVMDTPSPYALTIIPGDGQDWYFYVRARDRAGHWASGAVSQGPYWSDTTPPGNPSLFSSTPATRTWSNDNTVSVNWSGASDGSGSGVYGYSCQWSFSPASLPDTILDVTTTTTTSLPLSDSLNWYVHVRARDEAGNWNSAAAHYGPFYIDTLPPSVPAVVSLPAPGSNWYPPGPITFTWSTASDGGSGLAGYSYAWDHASTTWPDTSPDTTGNTYVPMLVTDGTWYFHLRACDAAGNCADPVHLGPYQLDGTPPANPSVSSGSHSRYIWSQDCTVDVSWSGASDGAGSGLAGYAYVWSQSPTTVPDPSVTTSGSSATSSCLATGSNWWFHIRAGDEAGNWNTETVHYGPFYIDRDSPDCQFSPPNIVDVNTPTFSVSWVGSDNGSGVASYDVQYWDTTVDTGWVTWKSGFPGSSDSFYGQHGHKYHFRCRARDQVGNALAFPNYYQREMSVRTVDFEVIGLEVTQAVQDLDNSVWLIAGKRTFARLHVRSLAHGDHVPVSAYLRAERWEGDEWVSMGALKPNNAGGTMAILQNPDRGQLTHSFYFDLPAGWIDGKQVIQLYAEVNRDRAWAETSYANNSQWLFGVVFRTRLVDVALIDACYTVGGTTYHVRDADRLALASWLRRAYPASRVDVRWFTVSPCYDHRPGSGADEKELLHALIKTKSLQALPGDRPDTRWYGMVDDGGGFMRGWSQNPGTVGTGPAGSGTWNWDFDGSYADWYGGHELGHTYNQGHTLGCGEGNAVLHYPNGDISPIHEPYASGTLYGFDIETLAIYAPDWKDVMTYCERQWVSDYTYESIANHLVSGVALDASRHTAAAGEEYLAVFGSIYTATDHVELDTFYRVPNGWDVFGREPGSYSIRLLDAQDTSLADYPFTPRAGGHLDPAPGEQPATQVEHVAADIAEYVPWVTHTARVAIYHGTQELASRPVSVHAPQLELVHPNGGEVLNGERITVTWTAGDADGDELHYALLYSRDNGASWQGLGVDITTTQLVMDAAYVAGTTQGKFRILASDGVNTAQDESDGTFSLPDKAPRLQLISPPNMAVYVPGQNVALVADAIDLEDGSLDDAAFTWHSSLSGTIGIGHMVHITNLVTGTHRLTLAAIDSGGHVVTATRTVYIGWHSPFLKVYLPIVLKAG